MLGVPNFSDLNVRFPLAAKNRGFMVLSMLPEAALDVLSRAEPRYDMCLKRLHGLRLVYTSRQLAFLFGVHRRTLDRWLSQGTGLRLARRWQILAVSLGCKTMLRDMVKLLMDDPDLAAHVRRSRRGRTRPTGQQRKTTATGSVPKNPNDLADYEI